MRYVSEQFKEKQNQLIRPPLKMHFEIAGDVDRTLVTFGGRSAEHLNDFDYTIAPVKNPKSCSNEYYYATLGDGKGVDDSYRICAPDISGGNYSTPNHSVPIGVTRIASANEEVMLGSTDAPEWNPMGVTAPLTLSFKGGLIPEVIRAERYINGAWESQPTVYNPDMSEEVVFTPSTYNAVARYRFYVKNSTKGGRYQLNWLRVNGTARSNLAPVIFENSYISSVSISEETDLTSQALPTYEMTVTCLDVNGEYAPETSYWSNQFKDGKNAFFEVGYKTDNDVEYASILYGVLSQKPTYDQGKITFKVSIPWKPSAAFTDSHTSVTDTVFSIFSIPNTNLNTGDNVDSLKFSSYLQYMFTNYDVFSSSSDDDNSVANNYFTIGIADGMQLTANALGCFIMSGFNELNIYKTVDVQYGTPLDYLTRYEQVKNTLESQPKVGSVSIIRNANTLSADYVDVEAVERVSITSQYNYGNPKFHLPFFAYGKAQLIDAQSSVSGVTVTPRYNINTKETKLSDGTIEVGFAFQASAATTIKPIVRFYRVDTTQYDETETVDSNAPETYVNNNEMITNAYTANKAKRVAKFISDVSNQFEVDVVQDIRYELGDVIRLETQKNVFKTCVITGLKFNFPGSKGHITCRKIFNLADSVSAIYGVDNCVIANKSGTPGVKVNGTENGSIVVGKLTYNSQPYLFVLGATGMTYSGGFSVTTITDDNSHAWTVRNLNAQGMTYSMPVIDLGAYDSAKESDYKVYGIKTLLMKLYAEQNMTAPIKYTNP